MTAGIVTTPGVRPTPAITNVSFLPRYQIPYCCVTWQVFIAVGGVRIPDGVVALWIMLACRFEAPAVV